MMMGVGGHMCGKGNAELARGTLGLSHEVMGEPQRRNGDGPAPSGPKSRSQGRMKQDSP